MQWVGKLEIDLIVAKSAPHFLDFEMVFRRGSMIRENSGGKEKTRWKKGGEEVKAGAAKKIKEIVKLISDIRKFICKSGTTRFLKQTS